MTFVVPVYNEERHIRAAVASILAQDGLAASEVILVLGPSTDRTDAIVADMQATEPRIRSVRNPITAISRAMNLGAQAAAHPIVVRVDAHCELPAGYAALGAEVLAEQDAVNVGGRMLAVGTTPFEDAVAWAYNSRVGLGGAIYHVGQDAGPAESAYLGIFDRDALLAIGGFDETISRGEDWELNHRFIESGRTVWYEPRLEVVYRPRSSVRALAKQFAASGRWRGELIRRLKNLRPARYFAPPLLVAAVIASGLGLIASAIGLSGVGAAASLAVPVLYLVAVAGIALTAHGLSAAARWRLPLVLGTMHLCWGWGCLVGLLVRTRVAAGHLGR